MAHIHITVTVNSITYSRITGAETWVTSDGRAYFVHLSENLQSSLSDTTSVGDTNGSEVFVLYSVSFFV